MGRKATGYVEAMPSSVRLCFHFEGKARREIVPGLAPTPAKNIRYAEQLLARINHEVANGLFNYEEHFPDSRFVNDKAKAAGTVAKPGTLGFYLDLHMQTKTHIASSTKAQYGNDVKMWKRLFGAETDLKRLLPSTVQTTVAGREWPSGRRYNNAMSPLRGALTLAMQDNPRLPELLKGVEARDREPSNPDPVSTSEMKAILTWIKANKDVRAWAYYAFSFATGMRPEEVIALTWSDVDERKLRIHVMRAKSYKGEVKSTKTGDWRWVDLGPLAVQALEEMTPWTRKNPDGVIFQNPWTDRAWYSSKAPNIRLWKPALKHCGIEPRRAYCTRHTFATLLLQAGARVAYVSSQMGHTTPSQVEITYARWLDDSDGGHARRMLADAFGRG